MMTGGGRGGAEEYPVFVRRGDARGEVDLAARGLGMSPAAAGLHKTIYAARADQTVVLVTSRDAPIAAALRERGWAEPKDVD